jgi:hypothetical protein
VASRGLRESDAADLSEGCVIALESLESD